VRNSSSSGRCSAAPGTGRRRRQGDVQAATDEPGPARERVQKSAKLLEAIRELRVSAVPHAVQEACWHLTSKVAARALDWDCRVVAPVRLRTLAKELDENVERMIAELAHTTPKVRATRIARLPADLGGLGLRGAEQMMEAAFVACSETTQTLVMRTTAALGECFRNARSAEEPDRDALRHARATAEAQGITMAPGRGPGLTVDSAKCLVKGPFAALLDEAHSAHTRDETCLRRYLGKAMRLQGLIDATAIHEDLVDHKLQAMMLSRGGAGTGQTWTVPAGTAEDVLDDTSWTACTRAHVYSCR